MPEVVERVRPYFDLRLWWRGLYLKWIHVFSACMATWVSSNGIEATTDKIDLPGLHDAMSGIGMSYKAAILQAVLHATYEGFRYVQRTTESAPPFPMGPIVPRGTTDGHR